jgi:hypothetical protein
MASDIALVTLTQPAHRAAGWLAVPLPEGTGAEPAAPAWPGWNLSTAGYPSDQAGIENAIATDEGLRQFQTTCTGGALAPDFMASMPECVGGACFPLLRHGCPSSAGQSGSPMWSPSDGTVRSVLVGSLGVEVNGVDVPGAALNLGTRPQHPSVRAALEAWFGEDEGGGAALPTEPSGPRPRRRLVRLLGVFVLDLADRRVVAGLSVAGVVVGTALALCAGTTIAWCVRERRVTQGLQPVVVRDATAVVNRGRKDTARAVEVRAAAGGGLV